MATTQSMIPVQTASGSQEILSGGDVDDESTPSDRFALIFGRMRGTMSIVGDVVSRETELWNCERD